MLARCSSAFSFHSKLVHLRSSGPAYGWLCPCICKRFQVFLFFNKLLPINCSPAYPPAQQVLPSMLTFCDCWVSSSCWSTGVSYSIQTATLRRTNPSSPSHRIDGSDIFSCRRGVAAVQPQNSLGVLDVQKADLSFDLYTTWTRYKRINITWMLQYAIFCYFLGFGTLQSHLSSDLRRKYGIIYMAWLRN